MKPAAIQSGISTLTSVNASGTSGAVLATVAAGTASFTGGSGKDSVTANESGGTTTVAKAISMGAGDDTVSFAEGTLAISNNVTGGDGTDTLQMTAAQAAAITSGGAVFQSYVSGFEVLKLAGDTGGVTADTTVVVADTGIANNVNVGEAVAASTTLTLDKFADAGTLTISANQSGTVALTNATAWPTISGATASSYDAKSVNIVLTGKTADTYTAGTGLVSGTTYGDRTGGNVSFDKVGTVNVTATDTGSSSTGLVASHTLTLTDAAAHIVNVSGNANLALTLAAGTKAATIDGSTMTGALTVTALAQTTGGTTVKGGSGNDVLTASTGTSSDALIGGDGNDTLAANTGANTLTGGAGNDTFKVTAATAAKTIFTTITDFSAGDTLVLANFGGTEAFTKTKVDVSTLAADASLSDAVNLAIHSAAQSAIKWFQFGGDTYVVEAAAARSSTDNFVDGSDLLVKLTGTVDLSVAGFNAGTVTLHI